MTMRVKTFAAIKSACIVLHPSVVLAAQETFGEAVEAITGLEWALVIILSLLSGGTALLIKISGIVNGAPPDALVPKIRSLPLMASSHMAGSLLVGVLSFFIAAHLGFPGLLVGFFVPALSFGGARAAEAIFQSTINRHFPAPPKDQS